MLRLPNKQELVWAMKLRDIPSISIASELGISKQAISLYLKQARAKLTEIFLDIAQVMDLEIIKLNVDKGVFIGKIKQTGERVYIYYIPGRGAIAIYERLLKQNKLPQNSNIRYVSEFYRDLLGIRGNDDMKVLKKIVSYAETI